MGRSTPQAGLLLLAAVGVAVVLALGGLLDLTPGMVLRGAVPLLLVGFGLDLLRPQLWRPWRPLLALLLVCLLPLSLFMAARRGAVLVTDAGSQLAVPLEGAGKARVTLEVDSGKLRLRPLPADDPLLAAGRVGAAEQSYEVDEGEGELELTMAEGLATIGAGASDWELRLNREVPLELNIEAGAGDLDLDLRALRLVSVKLESGASTVLLRLPAGVEQVTIDGGASSIVLELLASTEARLTLSTGVGTVSLPRRFVQQGDDYATPGWERATERMAIEIDAGAASIEVKER